MKLAVIALANFLSVAAANAPQTLHVADTPSSAAATELKTFQTPPHTSQPATRSVEPPRTHVCFNASETREKIVQHRLSDPLRALRAGRLQGEALRAKLCRFKQDDYVYEVFVLRRDGHIVRLYMNAQNGLAIAAPSETDRN